MGVHRELLWEGKNREFLYGRWMHSAEEFFGWFREGNPCLLPPKVEVAWQISKQNHFLCLKQFLLQELTPKGCSSQKWVICIIVAELQWTRLGFIITDFKMSDRFSNTFHPYMDIDKILLWRHSVSNFPHIILNSWVIFSTDCSDYIHIFF